MSTNNKESHRLLEGECFLKTRSDQLKRCWGVLIGTDFYCYANAHKVQCILMHTLVGTFLEEQAQEGEGSWWPIKIIIPPSKSRVIYFKSVKQQKEWFIELRQRARNLDINEYYSFGEILGQGQFGEV